MTTGSAGPFFGGALLGYTAGLLLASSTDYSGGRSCRGRRSGGRGHRSGGRGHRRGDGHRSGGRRARIRTKRIRRACIRRACIRRHREKKFNNRISFIYIRYSGICCSSRLTSVRTHLSIIPK